jgi:glycosyltransferase involved in cell wall biosynthesis
LLECHNVTPHESSLLDSVLTRFAFAPVHHFITHSREDKKNLLTVSPRAEVRVAPLPAIKEFYAGRQPARDGRTILFFGIVRKYKGLEVLLRAMPAVLRELDCQLVVVGEFYGPEAPYQSLVRDLGIQDHVRLENRYLANEEIPGCLDRADVLVLPYLSASQSGVARLALLHGLPIIASNTGGLSEVVQDGRSGFLFEPGDAEALAETIVRYFRGGFGPQFAKFIRTSSAEGSASVADVVEEMANSMTGLKKREGKAFYERR